MFFFISFEYCDLLTLLRRIIGKEQYFILHYYCDVSVNNTTMVIPCHNFRRNTLCNSEHYDASPKQTNYPIHIELAINLGIAFEIQFCCRRLYLICAFNS